MKIAIKAKPLAEALDLAASLVDAKCKIPALWHAHLVAAGDSLDITASVLDFALKLSVPATVETAGEIAVPSAKLAALAGGFPADAEPSPPGTKRPRRPPVAAHASSCLPSRLPTCRRCPRSRTRPAR
jgi:hypothetical protein